MRPEVLAPPIAPEHIIVTQLLFRPFQHKSLSLTNRVAMAPMTRWKSPNSIPGEDVAAYYRRRAEGGVGFIITEGTTIDRAGSSNDARIPNFYSRESLAGWRRVVEEVHAAGGKIAPQIWHMGMVRAAGTGPRPDGKSDGPSGLSSKGEQVAEPMTDADIADTIDAFARAAAAAKRSASMRSNSMARTAISSINSFGIARTAAEIALEEISPVAHVSLRR